MDAQVSGAPAGNGGIPGDSKVALNQVLKSVQNSLGLLHQLHCTVSSFNLNSQLNLLERINFLVNELDTMQKVAQNCDIQVPLEVIRLIDDGKNPDEFTKDIINSCIQKNQTTKGKTEAFKNLRKHLLEELEQAFPDEVEAYRELRTASAASDDDSASLILWDGTSNGHRNMFGTGLVVRACIPKQLCSQFGAAFKFVTKDGSRFSIKLKLSIN